MSQKISDLHSNMMVKGAVYAIDRLEIKPKRSGEQFFKFRLSDATGKVDAVMWDGVERLIGKISAGDIVRIEGAAGEYNKNVQITIRSLEVLPDLPPQEMEQFLPPPPIPVEDIYNSLQDVSATIEDQHLQRLIQLFWLDEETQKSFKRAPGGKKWHHPYLGGLLHHTLTVMQLCDAVAPFYAQVNRDELLTGALFHDVGKTEEFKLGATFDYSTSGRLIGHIHIGDNMLANYIDRLPDFPKEMGFRLRHIILSHHGEQGQAPVLPMTLEACMFYPIDLLDSQVNAYTRELTKAERDDQPWTEYVNLINRYLYRGDRSVADPRIVDGDSA